VVSNEFLASYVWTANNVQLRKSYKVHCDPLLLLHTCTHTHIQAHPHIYTHTHAHTYTYIRTHTHAHTHPFMHA
jgi:hypothetical protein